MKIPKINTQKGNTVSKGEGNSSPFIVVDKKTMGIWDLIKLGNQGGIINFENGFAIEVTKQSQRWCDVHVIRYGINAPKREQKFTPIKKVENKDTIKELKQQIEALKQEVKQQQQNNSKLQSELSKYTTKSESVVDKQGVIEI
jgi:hypothetical protein